MSSEPVRIGVLMLAPVQLLDTSAVDIFAMLDKDYLEACKLPAPLIAHGLRISVTYIAESGAGTIAPCTANAALRVNAGLDDEKVAPGQLDILFIPGPDPSAVPSKNAQLFIQSHAKSQTTIMIICTGVIPAAHSGILKQATGPRALLPDFKKKFPNIQWEEKRWLNDGNIWTSAGVTNGQDMVAAYIRQRWPGPLAETTCAMADVGYRSRDYTNSSTADKTWWVWQVLRAWIGSFGKSKK